MDKILIVLQEKVNNLLSLFRKFHILMQEQRNALKVRELIRIQEIADDLAVKLNDLQLTQIEITTLSNQYKKKIGCPENVSLEAILADSSDLEERGLSDSLKELISLGGQIKRENHANLLLVRGSIEMMRQVLKYFCPDNQVKYENDGTIRFDPQAKNVLNQIV